MPVVIANEFLGALADLDGVELGVARFDATLVPTANGGDVDSLTGEGTMTRLTFDGEWDAATQTLGVAVADQWPVAADGAGDDVSWAVVFVNETGHPSEDRMVVALPYTQHEAAVGWTFRPINGIARATSGADLDARVTALEALPELPDPADASPGQALVVNGDNEWAVSTITGTVLAATEGTAGQVLTTNGTTATWEDVQQVLSADILVRSDGFDPEVGSFTTLTQVGPLGDEGNRTATQSRATLAAAQAVVAVIDTGERWQITASGPCTQLTTPKGHQPVIVGASDAGQIAVMIGENSTSLNDPDADATSLRFADWTTAGRRLNNIVTSVGDGEGTSDHIEPDPDDAIYEGGAYDGLPIMRLAGYTPGDGGSCSIDGTNYTDPQTVIYLINQDTDAYNGVWELFTDDAGDFGTAGDVFLVRTVAWNSTTDNDPTSPMYCRAGNVFICTGGDHRGLWQTSGDGLEVNAAAVPAAHLWNSVWDETAAGSAAAGTLGYYLDNLSVGGGAVATDAIWDAKGDLAVGTGANTAAKLTVGANDTILMAASGEATGAKWATPAEVRTAIGAFWPYRNEIAVNVTRPTTVGTTWTPTVNSGCVNGGYGLSDASNTESWTWADIPCAAGTWEVVLMTRNASTNGIITVTFNGSSNTVDTYAGSTSANNRTTVLSGITVASDSRLSLVLTNPTKNASASAYTMQVQHISMRRTGA